MERHFDEELKDLKEKLLHMASLAEDVIQSDAAINFLEIEVDEICLKLLATRQPIANDLRFITSALKINSDLERIGDLSVNIAERTLELIKQPILKPLLDIPRMAQYAQKMVKDSLDAFVNREPNLARDVCRRDDEVDMLNDQIFRELLTYMIENPKTITRSVDLILVARHLERIADHATNISEDVCF